MFWKDDVNRGRAKDSHKRLEDGDPGEYVYTSHMGQVLMFVEVKTSDKLDPFTDPSPGDNTPGYRFTIDTAEEYKDDKEARNRVSVLGQNAGYARLIQTRQFRNCVYSVSIAGSTARLLRWDRSGVVVTKSFDYKSNPGILASFVWLFSVATRRVHGFDPLAISVDSEPDRLSFVGAIRRHVKEQLPELRDEDVEKEVVRHFWPGAITCLAVGAGAEVHRIWVSRPTFVSNAATGRSTVGYWGVKCDTKEVVFVKDVWRTNVPGVEMEGMILSELMEKEVRNIPELVCHGDVVHDGEAIFRFLCMPRSHLTKRRLRANHAHRRVRKRGLGEELAPVGWAP